MNIEDAIRVLLDEQKDYYARGDAAQDLRRSGDPRAIDPLVQVLESLIVKANNMDFRIRYRKADALFMEIIHALAKIGGKEGREALERATLVRDVQLASHARAYLKLSKEGSGDRKTISGSVAKCKKCGAIFPASDDRCPSCGGG